MSTTDVLRARIASELNRPLTGSFGNSGETFAIVVNREINAAIRHYQSQPFRWNQVMNSETNTTVSGTRSYSLPADFLSMTTLKLIYNGNYIPVKRASFEWIDARDTKVTAFTGIPTRYAIYSNILRLFPAPNGAYTLVASYTKRFLPTSVTGSYTAVIPVAGSYTMTVTTTASHNNRLNGWTTDGSALIRARATAAIKINYLKNTQAIAEFEGILSRREPYLCAAEAVAYQQLVDETFDIVATGLIKAYPI